MSKETTVYIVDDDLGSRNSVQTLVRSMGIRGEKFESAEEFLESFDIDSPGCLVTDLRMMGMSGVDLQKKLADIGCQLPVIIITAHAETPITVAAVQQGAVTVLEKPCRSYELFDAIQMAIAKNKLERESQVNLQDFRNRVAAMTEQEMDVLVLVVEGIANKVIAKRLAIGIRTVEARRQRIFEKTETKSVAELVRLVVQSKALEK